MGWFKANVAFSQAYDTLVSCEKDAGGIQPMPQKIVPFQNPCVPFPKILKCETVEFLRSRCTGAVYYFNSKNEWTPSMARLMKSDCIPPVELNQLFEVDYGEELTFQPYPTLSMRLIRKIQEGKRHLLAQEITDVPESDSSRSITARGLAEEKKIPIEEFNREEEMDISDKDDSIGGSGGNPIAKRAVHYVVQVVPGSEVVSPEHRYLDPEYMEAEYLELKEEARRVICRSFRATHC
ncbi:MAG: hypothetical protein GY790_17505, partial [Bacteroidetes bacterium]|nr:hypothetical protein [Bacteroidota bacterium]